MRHFHLKLKDEVVRGMTRKQYYASSHYVRYVAWLTDARINWDKFYEHFQDMVMFGYSKMNYRDMLL